MKTLGIEVSKARERLRGAAMECDKAVAFEQGKDIHEVSRLAQRIRRGEYNDGAIKKQLLKPDFDQRVPAGERRISKKRGPLSINDRIDIVYRMLVSFDKQADVAKDFRVSQSVVASLVHKVRKKKEYLWGIIDARDELDSTRETIKTTVESLNESRHLIDSVQGVVLKVNDITAAPVTEKLVRSVMKDELGMRFRKIKTVSLHSNSEKNIVLRQRWAIEFLALTRKKKIFLNIDETWIGMSDFRRMKW